MKQKTPSKDKPCILVVDDDPVARESIAGLLAAEGYQLEFAVDGPAGLRTALKLLPDVILLDVMMPGLNGFDVCRQLRSTPAVSEIPILILTTLDDQESLLAGLNAGADDFLPKPLNKLELRARLRTITRLDRYRKLNTERARLETALQELAASYLSLEQAYDETITGWARALDLRDHETEGHSQRVCKLTIQLAHALNLLADEIIHIGRGALLHDIGKLAIPDAILLKPGPLTDDEWAIMLQHPNYAREMLTPIAYLRPALVIPYNHHEKWDGTGYPCRLKGEQIPESLTRMIG